MENENHVTCPKCGTENSVGTYECVNCREVIPYDEPGDGAEQNPDTGSCENNDVRRRHLIIRKFLFNIPPFIILLVMLSLYMHYESMLLLTATVIIFMPWCVFCAFDIYNYKDWHARKKDDQNDDSPHSPQQ